MQTIAQLTNRIAALILVAAATLMIQTPASASTSTNSIAVSATVLAICTVSTNPLTLNNMHNANANLAVNCSNGTPYSVALSNAAGTPATQQMIDPTSGAVTVTLTY